MRTRGGGQIACFILIRDDGTMISSGAVVNCDTKGGDEASPEKNRSNYSCSKSVEFPHKGV